MTMTYGQAQEARVILNGDRPRLSGTVGAISWTRLIMLMVDAGEIRPDEVLTTIVVDERGLTYVVDKGEP